MSLKHLSYVAFVSQKALMKLGTCVDGCWLFLAVYYARLVSEF